MSKWKYNTTEKLVEAGYVFMRSGICSGRGCHAMIGWWKTPKGRQIPLDAATLEPHWATCANAGEFRTDRKGEK